MRGRKPFVDALNETISSRSDALLPARGRKRSFSTNLRFDHTNSSDTLIPERGRKQACALTIKKYLVCSDTLIPVRGRKPSDSCLVRSNRSCSDTLILGRGRKLLSTCAIVTVPKDQIIYIPRKGTETTVRQWHRCHQLRSDPLLPAGGRKLQDCLVAPLASALRYLDPREGAETFIV